MQTSFYLYHTNFSPVTKSVHINVVSNCPLTCKENSFTLMKLNRLLFDVKRYLQSLAENICTPSPRRLLPTDSGLDVSDTVCTSNRCLESTDRCSGCKLEAIAKAEWCVEASLFPMWW